MSNALTAQSTNLINVIDIIINDIPMKGCNARDLHAFLENGDEFANWIKDRICQYDFIENQDFALVLENSQIKKGRGGDRRSKDYHITLGMAKELAMVMVLRNKQAYCQINYRVLLPN
jgi:phage anti-repressor protein